MHEILTESGDWVQGMMIIARETCNYFQNIFTVNNNRIIEEILQCIPNLVTHEPNLRKHAYNGRIKKISFEMNPISAPGLDGIGGKFLSNLL